MSDSYIWGNLNKTINDPTLIEEAISGAINDHNDDPDAHVGPNQSLESHRAAEIIDHLAESVVNDKIRRTARRYVAIVDPSSEFDFPTLTSAVAYANSAGGGDIFIKRGVHYITGSLDVIPTVSFYGEGIGETVVESTNTGGSGLFYYKDTRAGDGYGVLYEELNGQSSFVFSTWFDAEKPPVAGMFLSLYGENPMDLEVLGYDENTDVVTLAGTIQGIVDEAEAEMLGGFRLVNSSSELTVFINDAKHLDRYFSGMTVFLNGNPNGSLTIERTGDFTFSLSVPWSGVTTFGPGYFEYTGRSTVNFENISVRRGNYGVIPTGNPGNATYRIQNCENIFLGFGGHAYYVGCRFDAISSQPLALGSHSVVDSCTFVAQSHNARGIQITGPCSIRSSYFYANGYSNHRWLYGVAHQSLILGNIFELQMPETIFNTTGNNSALGMRLIGNYFTFGSSGTFALQCVNSIISENSFMMGSANAPQLNATSARNIFANNRCSKTPVNSGTNNLMVNNLVVA